MKMYAAARRVMALCALIALAVGPLYAQDTTFQEQDTTTFGQQDTTMLGQQDTTSAQNIMAVIEQEPDLSTFAQALRQTGLEDSFRQGSPYTIFAPSNEAFEQLPEELSGLVQATGGQEDTTTLGQQGEFGQEDTTTLGQQGEFGQQGQQALIALLRRHIVADNVTSAAAEDLNRAVTLLGDTLDLSAEDGEVTIGEATVEQPDLVASNGVVHIIDAVLVPEGGVEELVRLDQQREMQMQEDTTSVQQDTTFMQQGQQGEFGQEGQQGQQDTTTFQPEPMEEEVDTLGVNNR